MFTLKRNLDKLLRNPLEPDNKLVCITKLVWVVWIGLAKLIKKDSINLQKTCFQQAKNILHNPILS